MSETRRRVGDYHELSDRSVNDARRRRTVWYGHYVVQYQYTHGERQNTVAKVEGMARGTRRQDGKGEVRGRSFDNTLGTKSGNEKTDRVDGREKEAVRRVTV